MSYDTPFARTDTFSPQLEDLMNCCIQCVPAPLRTWLPDARLKRAVYREEGGNTDLQSMLMLYAFTAACFWLALYWLIVSGPML